MTHHPEKYLELCELVHQIEPDVVWKMLFVYPWQKKSHIRMEENIDYSFTWARMPEGQDFWSELDEKVEELRDANNQDERP